MACRFEGQISDFWAEIEWPLYSIASTRFGTKKSFTTGWFVAAQKLNFSENERIESESLWLRR
jgi:hypothetical protein